MKLFNPTLICVVILFFFVSPSFYAHDTESIIEEGKPYISIEFFYTPGCEECRIFQNEILPKIQELFPGLLKVKQYDISKRKNYELLVFLENELNIEKNEPVSIFVNRRYSLHGIEEIEDQLEGIILKAEQESDFAIEEEVELIPEDTIRQRFELLTFSTVTIAALIDGVNPCAIATLIFFISMLSGLGLLKKNLIYIGVSYCLAVFITYLLIGLGLLGILRAISGLSTVRMIVNVVIIVVLVCFSFYSFYDALIYWRHREASSIKLQLPMKIKQRIHKIIRKNVNVGNLALGAFAIGIFVTILESVCTGQVYLPTLVFIARDDKSLTAWAYLFWYNLLFIFPLIIILFLAYRGVNSEALARFGEKNVIVVKSGLGLFFLGIALLMIFTTITKSFI